MDAFYRGFVTTLWYIGRSGGGIGFNISKFEFWSVKDEGSPEKPASFDS